jgi:hypothetical protein
MSSLSSSSILGLNYTYEKKHAIFDFFKLACPAQLGDLHFFPFFPVNTVILFFFMSE